MPCLSCRTFLKLKLKDTGSVYYKARVVIEPDLRKLCIDFERVSTGIIKLGPVDKKFQEKTEIQAFEALEKRRGAFVFRQHLF